MKLDRDTLVSFLAARFKQDTSVIAVYLFGSRASGTEHAGSDIDIGVIYDWEYLPDPLELYDLRLVLMSELGCDVDLVCLNSAGPVVGMQALTRGIACWVSDADKDALFAVDLLNDYLEWVRMANFNADMYEI